MIWWTIGIIGVIAAIIYGCNLYRHWQGFRPKSFWDAFLDAFVDGNWFLNIKAIEKKKIEYNDEMVDEIVVDMKKAGKGK